MRICLLTPTYPPASTEGIPRQRQLLAEELVCQGHEVHVVTCGWQGGDRCEANVFVHEVPVRQTNHYSGAFPAVDSALTIGQALHEGLCRLSRDLTVDVVDVPLWSAPGFVAACRYRGPVIVWLQTSTAQLLAIHGNRPTAGHRAMVGLERHALARSSGILADSASVMEAVLGDYGLSPVVPRAVVHLGVPPLRVGPVESERAGEQVEALVVGRLETRKGTPMLLRILPGLLRRHPRLTVRFVGSDNSEADGWYQRHGLTYVEYFEQRHHALRDRVRFEGYVSDERLAECYRHAHVLLVPSVYESFGLVYLEAMRAGLPVVSFAAGGACEIFPDGESHGAILATPGGWRSFAVAVTRIVREPALRRRLGACGLERFNAMFRVERMAGETVKFYGRIIDHFHSARVRRHKVLHVMEALTTGDAVSAIARRTAGTLSGLGESPAILSQHWEPEAGEVRPLHEALDEPHAALLFHYWNYNLSAWFLETVLGPKAVYYHNITPARFFPPGSLLRENAARGYAQLSAIADGFDLIVGDSRYNLAEYACHMRQPKPALCIYPVVERDAVLSASFDRARLSELSRPGVVDIVFVGRIARNKRQDRLMRMFDYYYRAINRHARLWLVGSNEADGDLFTELEHLRCSLDACENIIFTGKVSDPELNAFFRGADVLVSSSEHEGFCMPLAQAMAFRVPVMAYAATAVPETMGESGILIHEWDDARVAEFMHLVLTDYSLRRRLLETQDRNLERFTQAAARAGLKAVCEFLSLGRRSPLFETLEPRRVERHGPVASGTAGPDATEP